MAPKKSFGSLSAMAKNIKEKAAAAKPSTSLSAASSSFKSAQHVQDSDTSSSDDSSSDSGSDSDSDIETAKKKLDAKNAAKKASASTSTPQVNGKTNKIASPAAAKAASNTKKAAATSSSDDSSSSGSSSDSDSDADNKTTTQAPKPTAGKKPSVVQEDSDTSDSESDSDSDSEAGAKVQSIAQAVAAKAVQTKAAIPAKKPAKIAEESSDSSSEDESEDDTKAVATTNGASGPSDVVRPEWLNKSDFMIRKAATDNPGQEVSEFLSKSNLEGKQVWYFTAPASLPITVIKDLEIDLAKAQSGGAILNHQGDAYGLDLEPYTTSSQIQLLIPSKGGDKYNTLNRSIDSTVHLRRIAEFGGASKVSSTATDQYVRKIKPIREQPKNLKPRFTPFGVPTQKPSAAPAQNAQPKATKSKPTANATSDSSSSSDSDSDIEMTDAAALPSSAAAAKKRKQSTESSTSDSGSSSSSSDSEDEPPPSKKTKAPAQSTKRTRKSAPAVQAENTAIPIRKLASPEVKKSTPVPPPTIGRSFSDLSASVTPSKGKKEKKSKTERGKSSDNTPKAISQTPIPVPKFNMGN